MSNQDVVDAEAAQGGSAEGSSPQDKERAGLMAELSRARHKSQTLETQLAELKGTVDTLKQTQQQPKEHSKADLQTAVDAGRISQVDADRIWDEQRERKMTETVSTTISTQMQEQERARKITDEIGKYREFRPDIMDDGSEARALVAAEYSRQVTELGKPQNMQTELDALAATFGPASKLQKGREPEAETHQDVGSDGGQQTEAVGKAPKGLDASARKHYGNLIERGMYKDWSEVAKELSYASAGPKRRLGI